MKSETRNFILKFTRSVIKKYVEYGGILEIPKDYPEELRKKKGVFVTLYSDKSLRGCIGIPYPTRTAIENLRDAAISVTRDPRFLPLSEDELKNVKIEVSLLTEPRLIEVRKSSEYLQKIREDLDGVIIKKRFCEALFLPQVWREIPDKVRFLENLCLKAGLAPDEWKSKDAKLYKFQVEIVTED